jgi:hypothetical protein
MVFRLPAFVVLFILLSHKSVAQAEAKSIFNGKDLTGWNGDPAYWRVENQCIVGEVTPQNLLIRNSFLTWIQDTVRDFVLELEFRITLNGNSGINYRSVMIDSLPFAMRGYQADIGGYDSVDYYTGMNYEERGRTILALRGQRVRLFSNTHKDVRLYIRDNTWTGKKKIENIALPAEKLRKHINAWGEWNRYRIEARGNRLRHFVNNTLMSEVIDDDKIFSRSEGLIGIQVHVGPPMKVEYRNIQLTHL